MPESSTPFKLIHFLYFILFLLRQNQRKCDLFTGNKNTYISQIMANKYPNHMLFLLDDGLSTYGLACEQPSKWNVCKFPAKKVVSLLLNLINRTYYHETRISDLDRQGCRILLLPELYEASDPCPSMGLGEYFSEIGSLSDVAPDRTDSVFVASYRQSLDAQANKNIFSHGFSEIIYHPRIVKSSLNIPTDIYIMSFSKITMGMSSVLLYLILRKYCGDITIIGGEREIQLMEFISKRVALTFKYQIQKDPA